MTASAGSSFRDYSEAIKSPPQIRDLCLAKRYDCQSTLITPAHGVACDFGVIGVVEPCPSNRYFPERSFAFPEGSGAQQMQTVREVAQSAVILPPGSAHRDVAPQRSSAIIIPTMPGNRHLRSFNSAWPSCDNAIEAGRSRRGCRASCVQPGRVILLWR